jgi:ABC-2 type transport system ATP-binding protein
MLDDAVQRPPALEIRGLTKRYDDGTVALDRLDLTIPDGAFFGLLGPNGAGKTTLINSVAGLVRVTAGSIRVFGHRATGDGLAPLAARTIVGLSPQDVNLDRFLTVYESLLYHGGYYGMSRAAAAARAEEMIDVFDLRAKRDTRTTRLSGGMKRRLLLARALLHEPRLVILDEPTAGVDFELRMELWRYIRLLHERGTTILLTTHYLEEAESLCERIALIRGGRIAALDSPSGLRERYDAASLDEVYIKAMGTRADHVEAA